MKTAMSTLLALLFAGAAIASPMTSSRGRAHKPQRVPKPAKLDTPVHPASASSPPPEFFANLGGLAVSGSGITAVQATFTVPNVTLAPNDYGANEWIASAYVAIDGNANCQQQVYLAAGVQWQWDPEFPFRPCPTCPIQYPGNWNYVPYIQFYPADPVNVEMNIAPGHSITAVVAATSPTFGLYTITDHTTSTTVHGNFTSQTPLCETSAGFLFSNYNGASGADTSGQGQNPDFGNFYFDDASYFYGGKWNGLPQSNAAQVFMIYNNTISTGCSYGGANTVNCGWSD